MGNQSANDMEYRQYRDFMKALQAYTGAYEDRFGCELQYGFKRGLGFGEFGAGARGLGV